MPLDVLSDHAGQVIVGRVAELQSYWTGQPREIESRIKFEGVEYLKGALPGAGASFELVVPGGAIDGLEMRIGCAPSFVVGEKWVLFLLPTYRTFPVVGLSQGALRVASSVDGVERVFTASGAAVTGIDARGFIRAAAANRHDSEGHLHDSTGARVHVEPIHAGDAAAIPLADFLTQIRPALDRSRQHALNGPAGQRMAVPRRPVTLVGAAGSTQPEAEAPRGIDAVQPADAAPRARPEPMEPAPP